MADALTPPLLVASMVLMVAAVAKLRAPEGAVRALITLGVSLRGASARALVRVFAMGELALGAWAFVGASRVACGLLCVVYAAFAGMTLILARRRATCGCFGAEGPPASAAGSALSAAFALLALAAALTGVHGARWLLDLPEARALVLGLALSAATYGAVLAYTVVPTAWNAWSAR
ncbi:MAG: MauE/DoxX family redox-associated membrane protein [Solirubrobacteraceae bacterium]|jgi:hypothetical protein